MNTANDQTDQFVDDEILSVCAYCGKNFKKISLALLHIKEVHESGSSGRTCQNTSENAVSNSNPNFPETREGLSPTDRTASKGETSPGDNRRRFPCHICDKSFTKPYYLKRHIETVHEKIKRYKCDRCGKAYAQKQSLKEHIMKNHPSQEKTEYNQQGPAGQPGALDA